MLSIASFRYRDVLAEHGGPIRAIESGRFPVRGKSLLQANAWLADGLIPTRSAGELYGTADGTGTAAVLSVARHKAVSEALERWAFHVMARSDRAAEFAFDVDPSTNGMSAFPGLLRRQARRSAVLEAVERFCLIGWWEGRIAGEVIGTDWPGVSAIAINGPFGGVTVIAYARTDWGGYVYGHAAEESLGAATERAVVELARHEWILRGAWLSAVGGARRRPVSIFEKRIVFFASDEGHELFQGRLRGGVAGPALRAEVLCDAHLPGPWDDYATVWRFALRPISDGYIRGGERYFFL
jgi:hypothetical protein